MKTFLLGLLALLFCSSANANYVNSGVSNSGNFASASTFTCVPNTSVTSGNTEYVFVQYNSINTYVISSTRVPVWTQDRFDNGTGDTTILLHGAVTSTGAETITVTTSAGQLGGVMCGEYTQGSNVSYTAGASGTFTVTADAGVDIVTGSSACCASITLQSPFTTRQTLSLGGTTFTAFGDFHTTVAGPQTITFTHGSEAYADTTCTYACARIRHEVQIAQYVKKPRSLVSAD